jgi:hypothetical protein
MNQLEVPISARGEIDSFDRDLWGAYVPMSKQKENTPHDNAGVYDPYEQLKEIKVKQAAFEKKAQPSSVSTLLNLSVPNPKPMYAANYRRKTYNRRRRRK